MQHEDAKTCCPNCSTESCCTDRLRESVADAGGRLTKERRLLMKILCDYEGHFTPESLQQHMVERGFSMALTTIYRNLPVLARAGLIRRTSLFEEDGSHGATYEHVWGKKHHDHLVCVQCGKLVEFQYPALEVLQEAVAKEHGFQLASHHLELIGYCPDCTGRQGVESASPEESVS
jgi:Fur family transcriptional regulator, ferric uptake regulator